MSINETTSKDAGADQCYWNRNIRGCTYLAVNTTLLVALEVDSNEGAMNNVPQRVKSKLHEAAARAARPATVPTNSLSEHCFVRTADTT